MDRVSPMTSMIAAVTLSSVIIMSVLLKWTLPVALAVALAGCGNRENRDQIPADVPATAATTTESHPASPPPALPPECQEDPRPVIAAFGDSLSAGFGVEPGKSYPDDLQRLLNAAGYGYRVVNLGVSGDTTTDGVERLPSLLAVHPAIVIL